MLVTRRLRGCGRVGIPPVLRDFQAASFPQPSGSVVRSVPATASLGVVATEDVRSVAYGQRTIQMLVHDDPSTR